MNSIILHYFTLIKAAIYVGGAGICFLREKVSHYISAHITGGLSSVYQSEVWGDIQEMLFHPKKLKRLHIVLEKSQTYQEFFFVSSGAEIRPLSQWDLGDFFPNLKKKFPISKKKKKKKKFFFFFFLEFSFSHHTHTLSQAT